MASPKRKNTSKRKRPPSARKPQRRDARARAHGLRFTEETKRKILARIRNGASRELAAEASGITARTLQRWMAKGRDEQADHERLVDLGQDPGPLGEFAVFALDVIENESLALLEDAKVVRDAAWSGDVAAAQWRLAKLRPEQYGDRTKHQIVGGDLDDGRDVVGEFLERLGMMAERLGIDPPQEDEGGDDGGG